MYKVPANQILAELGADSSKGVEIDRQQVQVVVTAAPHQ
jgi:hypothetical protein